jgi:hypothetical protein
VNVHSRRQMVMAAVSEGSRSVVEPYPAGFIPSAGEGVDITIAIEIPEADVGRDPPPKSLTAIGERAEPIVEPHRVGPLLPHIGVDVSITVEVSQEHAEGGRDRQPLPTVLKGAHRPALGSPLVEQHETRPLHDDRDHIDVVVTVQVTQVEARIPSRRDVELLGALEMAVPIVEPDFHLSLVAHHEVEVEVAIQISQSHVTASFVAQRLPAIGEGKPHRGRSSSGSRGGGRR